MEGRVIRSRKRLDSRKRIEEVDDDKLNTVGNISPQDISATVTRDILQRRKDLVLEMSLISSRVFNCRPTTPMTRNHDCLLNNMDHPCPFDSAGNILATKRSVSIGHPETLLNRIASRKSGLNQTRAYAMWRKLRVQVEQYRIKIDKGGTMRFQRGLQENPLEWFYPNRMFPCIEIIQQCVVMSNNLLEREGIGVCG